MPVMPPHSHWLRRRRPTASAHTRLGWHNIYVLPTRAGWILMGVLLVLLLASVNYQLSLGYLLTFLLAGSMAASVGLAHANLRGLELHALPADPVHAGQTLTIRLRLCAPSSQTPRTRRAIFVGCGPHTTVAARRDWGCVDLERSAEALLEIGWPTLRRGRIPLPMVTVQTLFPLGAFRLWSHWQPAQQAWVYPAAEVPPPPYLPGRPGAGAGSDATPSPPHVDAEPDGVRGYQRGDPLRHIVWKKAAQALATGSHQLVSRSHASPRRDTRWLQESATGLTDAEARLSRLTAWALQMEHAHQAWGLQLYSGLAIEPARGSAHFHHCMQALTLYGRQRGSP